MKRHLSDPRNPGVYALFVRSGFINRLKPAVLTPEADREFHDLFDASRRLHRAGVVNDDELKTIFASIRRRRAHAVLSGYRQMVSFRQRAKDISAIRAACGNLTAYQVRMGYAHA